MARFCTLSQCQYKRAHAPRSAKRILANTNNDTDQKKKQPQICTYTPGASHIQLGTSKDSYPLALSSLVSPPVAGVELLISTAMNTRPEDGEGGRQAGRQAGNTVCARTCALASTISVSSADSRWRLAEKLFWEDWTGWQEESQKKTKRKMKMEEWEERLTTGVGDGQSGELQVWNSLTHWTQRIVLALRIMTRIAFLSWYTLIQRIIKFCGNWIA